MGDEIVNIRIFIRNFEFAGLLEEDCWTVSETLGGMGVNSLFPRGEFICTITALDPFGITICRVTSAKCSIYLWIDQGFK